MFCFRLFDIDGDGFISYDEMVSMLQSMWRIEDIYLELAATPDSSHPPSEPATPASRANLQRQDSHKATVQLANEAFEHLGIPAAQGSLNFDAFEEWISNHPVALHFIDTIKRMAHADLGMRPNRPADEMKVINETTDFVLSAGEVVYLVPRIWWERWEGFVAGNGSDPGAIDNSCLVDANGALTVAAEQVETQCKLISEDKWLVLTHWYGGRPAVPRHVAARAGSGGSQLFVDYFPLTFRCTLEKSRSQLRNDVPLTCSKSVLVGELHGAACRLFNTKPQFTRLWHNEQLLSDMEVTLEDALLEDNRHIIVEVADEAGVWGRHTESRAGMMGLGNLGNTCYFNSGFQCLASIEPLREYFQSGQHKEIIMHKEHLFQLACQSEREKLDHIWSQKNHTCSIERAAVVDVPPDAPDYKSNDTDPAAAIDPTHVNTATIPTDQAPLEPTEHPCSCCRSSKVAKCSNETRSFKEAAKAEEELLITRMRTEALHGYTKRWLAEEYGALMDSLWMDPVQGIKHVEPKDMLQLVRSVNKDFEGNAQQDAHELLMTLLTSLHEALNDDAPPEEPHPSASSATPATPNGDTIVVPSGSVEPRSKQSAEEWSEYRAKHNSVVASLMHGFKKNTRSCENCHHSSMSHEAFLFYQVTVPQPPPMPLQALVVYNDSRRRPTRFAASIEAWLTGNRSELLAKYVGVDWGCIVPAIVTHRYIQELVLDDQDLEKAVDRVQDSCSSLSFFELASPLNQEMNPESTLIRLVQRRIASVESYVLLPPVRAELIGAPLVISLSQHMVTGKNLYDAVLEKVLRYIEHSLMPEVEILVAKEAAYPFQLKFVDSSGAMCSRCMWSEKHCLGCCVPCDANETITLCPLLHESTTLAIDWDLKYFDAYEEAAVVRHSSVDSEECAQQESFRLEDCLRADSEPEMLEFSCGECGHNSHTSKSTIAFAPDILAVHLKRFEAQYVNGRYTSRKLETMVDVQLEGFDLTEFTEPELRDGPQLYDLVAVVNHKGHLGGGHYIAYTKHMRQGKWHCYNDRVVSEVSEDQVITPMAYVLFFQKQSAEFPTYSPVQLYPKPQASCWESLWMSFCKLSSCCENKSDLAIQRAHKKREQYVEAKVEKLIRKK